MRLLASLFAIVTVLLVEKEGVFSNLCNIIAAQSFHLFFFYIEQIPPESENQRVRQPLCRNGVVCFRYSNC